MFPDHCQDVTVATHPTFPMLPTITFGQKYCRSSQRAQQEIYKSNVRRLKSKLPK